VYQKFEIFPKFPLNYIYRIHFISCMKIILAPWKELVGVVESVGDGGIVFSGIGEIGVDSEFLISEASKNIGNKVSILRTDIEGKEYLIRREVR